MGEYMLDLMNDGHSLTIASFDLNVINGINVHVYRMNVAKFLLCRITFFLFRLKKNIFLAE